MKKIVLLGFVIVFFAACKTTYSSKKQYDLKGNWMISKISYSKAGINVKSFSLMDAKCFKNSVWSFVANNQTGNFTTMSSEKCKAINMNYKWYITPENQFGLKFLENGVKAKNNLSGYVLNINDQTENSFSLTQNANLDGNLIQINYQFIKN